MNDQDNQDAPFLDYSFESDSPFPEDSDSALQAPMLFAQHSIDSDNDSGTSRFVSSLHARPYH